MYNTNKFGFKVKLVYSRRIGEEKEGKQYLVGFFEESVDQKSLTEVTLMSLKFMFSKKILLYIIIKETTREYEKCLYIYENIYSISIVHHIFFFFTRICERFQ